MNSINKKGSEKMNDDFYVFSFGGGVQSTAMLLLMREGKIRKPDLAVFADPGNEPQKVIDHIENVCVPIFKEIGVKFVTAKYSDFFDSESLGAHFFNEKNHVKKVSKAPSIPFHLKSFVPGEENKGMMLPRQCTKNSKIDVVNKIIKKELGIKSFSECKKRIIMMIGISIDEVQRVSESKIKKINHFYPLIFDQPIKDGLLWAEKKYSRIDCISKLEKHSIKAPKSSCFFCPYKSHKDWIYLMNNDPESFNRAVEYDEKIRSIKEFNDAELYLHSKKIPLKSIQNTSVQDCLFDEIDHGFNAECEGMCGI